MDYVLNATPRKEKLLEQLTPRPVPDDNPAPPVLSKDHPLLERFQQSLKQHLLKVEKELRDELDELDHVIKLKNTEREDVGVTLYDLQEEIDNQRNSLEDLNTQIKDYTDRRQDYETNVKILKLDYDTKNMTYKETKRQHNERLLEIDNLQKFELNITKWAQEAKDELDVAKRVVKKDEQDQLAIAQEKRQMDLILHSIDTELRSRERELQNINDQLKDQTDFIEVLNTSLYDANSDLDCLQQEHKRLIQAWSEVIIAIQHRDKVLSKIKTDLDKENEEHKLIQSSINATKRAAAKEMEQNEELERFRARLLYDIETVEKQVDKDETENTKLLDEAHALSILLEKTELDVNKAHQEGLYVENQMKKLRAVLEKQAKDKFNIEEEILLLIQDQITVDKAGDYRGKILRDIQVKRRNTEILLSSSEYQVSAVLLELEKWKGQLEVAKANFEQFNQEKQKIDQDTISINEQITTLRNSVNIKYRVINKLNGVLQHLIASAGGQELSPAQIKMQTLERNINEVNIQISETQTFWLRLQGHLVHMAEKRATQLNEIQMARQQMMIINQKTMKIENQLEAILAEDRENCRQLSILNAKHSILSAQLFKKKRDHEQEEEICELTHSGLIEKLKDAEMSILILEQELIDVTKEIEETKQIVVQKHRDALNWESKYKMTAETKRYRDDEFSAKGEIGCMKAEIHRMEVRLNHLKRAQERLVQDLDNCVQHRDHIYTAASAKEKLATDKSKLSSTITHRLNEMKNKLRQINNETTATENKIAEITIQQEELENELKKRQNDINNEKEQDKLLQIQIEQGLLLKQENLENIIRKQHRAKRYKLLTTVKQLPKCRSETIISQEMQHQQEIHENLISIADGLLNDFPLQKFTISRILLTLRDD